MDKHTVIMTFMAATDRDSDRVPLLLSELGVAEYIKHDASLSAEQIQHIFTVKTDIDVEVFYRRMARLIEQDARFAGMRQCYKTLREGFRPRDPASFSESSLTSQVRMMLFSG